MRIIAITVCSNVELHAEDAEALIIRGARWFPILLDYGDVCHIHPSPSKIYDFFESLRERGIEFKLRVGMSVCRECQERMVFCEQLIREVNHD